MSPRERTQSQTQQPGSNQLTQRPGASRGQMQNLFTSGRWGTRAPSPRFQVPPYQGAKSPTLSSARNYSRSTGARPQNQGLSTPWEKGSQPPPPRRRKRLLKEILQAETLALRSPKHSPYLGSERRALLAQGRGLLQQTLGLACSHGRPGTHRQGLQGPWCRREVGRGPSSRG